MLTCLLYSVTRSQSCAVASLRIATFNLYNVQMKWPTRRGMIARALTEVSADIVGLQEVRIAAPASKNGHQAAELQQLLLGTQTNTLSHPHLVYQRVSAQNEGLEEGIALLSRFPIQRWGVRILLSSAELAKRPPRRHTAAFNSASDRKRGGPTVGDEDDSGLVWFSDSGKPPLTVPPDSRVVLYARVLTPSSSVTSSSSNSPSPVDVFVTHWPVSDREQCTAAMQTKHFADRVWNQKASGSGSGGVERVPQVLTGDMNVYFDFDWPIDFLFGRVLANAALNKCWSDSFARAFERRDSETGLFSYRHCEMFSLELLSIALGSLKTFTVSAIFIQSYSFICLAAARRICAVSRLVRLDISRAGRHESAHVLGCAAACGDCQCQWRGARRRPRRRERFTAAVRGRRAHVSAGRARRRVPSGPRFGARCTIIVDRR